MNRVMGDLVMRAAVRVLSPFLLAIVLCAPGGAVSIWTEHNDNSRTGDNLSETALTPSNINANQFGALFHYSLDDESYSQPLYVPGLTMAVDGKTHNVVFVATVNNSVYAFDADSSSSNGGNPLWHANLTPSGARPPNAKDADAQGACGGNYFDIAGNYGIIGTPVINQSSSTLYVIARTVENGAFVQRLHALNITSGAEKFGGPVVISGSYGGVNFDPALNNQRTALTLANGTIYAGWSSHCDNGAYHGFIMGFNETTLALNYIWASTNSSGAQGGIWQGGQGVTADGSGNLYLLTGNGTWDGNGNFGESAVKLSGSLSVSDYFTPSNWATLNGGDTDLGAAGLLGIPGTSYVFGGGKQGMVYLLNTNDLGHEGSTDNVVQEFQATFPPSGDTGHIHGGPVYFNTGSAQYVYLWGENDYLRAFQFDGTFDSTAVATSAMRAPTMNVGMPGGFLSVSANGTSNGVIWALTPYNGDANATVVSGILHAFNAIPSNGQLVELWNSRQDPLRDDFGNFSKFTYPTIANGKVYLSSWGTSTIGAGQLWVYGSVSPTVSAGVHTLTPECAPQSMLDDTNGSTTNGNKIQIWQAYSNDKSQQWNFANAGGQNFNIAVNYGPYCLDGNHGAPAGTQAQIWACDGDQSEEWAPVLTDGGFQLRNAYSGFCLDDLNYGTKNGNAVQSQDCSTNDTAQLWMLDYTPPTIPNGTHTLAPQNATGSRLDDSGGRTTNGNEIDIYQQAATANQQWNFNNIGGSTYTITLNLGPYCLDDNFGSSGTATHLWECIANEPNQEWTATYVQGGYQFQNPAGTCLDVSGGSSQNGTVVDSYTCGSGNVSQIWAVN